MHLMMMNSPGATPRRSELELVEVACPFALGVSNWQQCCAAVRLRRWRPGSACPSPSESDRRPRRRAGLFLRASGLGQCM